MAQIRTARSGAAAIHLLNRAGFGPRLGDADLVLDRGFEAWIDRQLAPEAEHDSLTRKLNALPAIERTASEFVLFHQRDNQSLRSVTCQLEELRTAKLLRAIESRNQLREVLVDFWYNHFNVHAQAWPASVPQYEHDAIRPYVLGRFRDLLGAVAHSPAMMYFLDTYISTANRTVNGKLILGLNENYGRELLELHTVGVTAGYRQEDVTEAARCFTGWDFGGWQAPVYEFRFAHDNHDRGSKNVFGIEIPAGGGESDGELLLDQLSAHPATARFVSWRLAQRFVADDPPESLVARCAATFLRTGGSIRDVMYEIFASDEFWSEQTRRAKVKSPFEFTISAIRAASASLVDGEPLAAALSDMGMPLYECKPPTGYSNRSTDWVNVSSQLHRINFAIAVATGEFPGIASGTPPPAWTFESQILGAPLADATRQSVARLNPLSDVPIAARELGLLLASPEFQVK